MSDKRTYSDKSYTCVLDLVLLKVWYLANDYPRQRPSKVYELMHGE